MEKELSQKSKIIYVFDYFGEPFDKDYLNNIICKYKIGLKSLRSCIKRKNIYKGTFYFSFDPNFVKPIHKWNHNPIFNFSIVNFCGIENVENLKFLNELFTYKEILPEYKEYNTLQYKTYDRTNRKN